MTFAPQQRRPDAMPRGVQRIVFWILMIGMAAFLWERSSKSPHAAGIDWLSVFAAVAGVFVAWVVIYLAWKKVAQHRAKNQDSPNRPIG